MFDHIVELIENHEIFHNNSNVPQLPVPVQLAIVLVCLGHYGNTSAPEYVAQWAGVSVGMVINSTYRCFVAFLALHDEAVMFPPEEEKKHAKDYVAAATCPEWRNRFLLADGTKFLFFKSLDCTARHGLTRTRTTLSIVRYVSPLSCYQLLKAL